MADEGEDRDIGGQTEPILVVSDAEMQAIGAALARLLAPGDVIALNGTLGCGKTTLTRGLLHELGLEEEAPSPSFAIVQAYEVPEVRLPLAHVDLYRLDDEADMEELGLDDYLYDGALVIEWPERMGSRLWPHALVLTLSMDDPAGPRTITATLPPQWKEKWPFQ
ncbi:MAG: tRNA (adenosine(37)-N6)-threonylcarbamoyltransferase complex ATPase subunit type 1 TsaE [Sphingobium sp.]|nr:tRNA (adenosine(37)-N6)-threonylcarbamoyltransferase complex ATPase subunit type 1 TsaE [Sphingobium sp.]